MKLIGMMVSILLIAGCTYTGSNFKDYLDDPRAFIRDPHYSQYQDQRNALERQYLNRQITYSVYMQKMQTLDDTYSQEVENRTRIIDSTY